MSLTGDVLGQIGAEVSLNGGVGGSIQFTGEGTDNYDELDNRPSINGVVLTGNKTTEELNIHTGGTDDYLDLNNKPKINGVTLRGDVSSASLQIPYDDIINRPVIPDLTDLENRMDAVEGDIQSIETDIGDIGDRLIDIASDIATIQATDLVQNSDISSLKNRMNAAENNIINLGSRLNTAEGTISTHTSDISGLDNRLDTAEDNISNAQNDISDLQGDVTSLDTIVGDGQQTVGSDLTDAVTQLNSILTQLVHTQSGSGAYGVDNTLQIDSNILNHSVVVICCGRYGYGNSIVLSSDSISAGFYANGIGAYINSSRHVTLKVSTSGLITVVETNDALNIVIIGIN